MVWQIEALPMFNDNEHQCMVKFGASDISNKRDFSRTWINTKSNNQLPVNNHFIQFGNFQQMDH